MTEKKIFQMAQYGASQIWAKADSDFKKNPKSKFLQEAEQRAWETLMEIEKIAEEKGYSL